MCNCKAGQLGMPCMAGNSAVTRGVSPDTMRHGGFFWEVRGSDRTSQPRGRDAAERPYNVTNPDTNQAGKLAPMTGAQSQYMRKHVGAFVQTRDPVLYKKGFLNNVGKQFVRSATNITVVADGGYDGILPITLQPIINKPLPYA